MADNKPKLPNKSGAEYGASGTIIQNGFITAEEYNRVLIGKSALLKYDIMRRSDAGIRSTLQVCKLPILSTTWTIKPAVMPDGSISPADQEVADFINRELFKRNINFHDLLRQILTMFDFGFSVFEKVFEITEFNGKARIGIRKIGSRKQTTIYAWAIPGGTTVSNNSGNYTYKSDTPGITQMTINETYYIPWEKLIVFTHDKEGDNHEGISLLRYVYKDWDIKDKLMIVNAIALEKMAVGVPIIRQDPTAPNAVINGTDNTDAETALKEFRANEKGYLKTPPGMLIEMLDMKGNTTKDVQPFLTYLDSRIAKSVLAGFMEIGGSSGTGAQALAKDLTSLFMKSEEAVANVIKGALAEQLIHQLCDLNFTDLPNGYPELDYGTIGDEDMAAFAEAINKVMTAGALTPDVELEDRIRDILRLPAMSTEAKQAFKDKQELAKKALEAPAVDETSGKPLPPGSDTTKGKGKDTTTAKDKAGAQKAALDATRDAQRKIIEVIYADDED